MITIPLRLGRGQNNREHWRVAAKRKKAEREAVGWVLKGAASPMLPCVVTITRVSPRGQLDDDNLSGSAKHCRDEIAAWLGVDDAKSSIVRYEYAQARGPWGVKVEFRSME